MQAIGGFTSGLTRTSEGQRTSGAARLHNAVRETFSGDYLERLDQVELGVREFSKGNYQQVERPDGLLRFRDGNSLLKTDSGFVQKSLSRQLLERPLGNDWKTGHYRTNGRIVKFDAPSQTVTVRELSVRPHLEGFGKNKQVVMIGQVTDYSLNLANEKVEGYTKSNFKGEAPEALLADFRRDG